jgi:hypothetical protein
MYADSTESKGNNAALLHKHLLLTQRKVFGEAYSSLTCLCCVIRRPERGLPCGHTLCETCIKMFGHRLNTAAEYRYKLEECLLCGGKTQDFTAEIKPPTCGARIISIDGGGVRAVLPMRFLRGLEVAFERITGVSLPIQLQIDLAVGTSSGMLNHSNQIVPNVHRGCHSLRALPQRLVLGRV